MLIKDKKQLERVRTECRRLVTKRSLVSAATGALPGGVAGAASDLVNLQTLLPAINKKFGLDPTQIDELDEQLKEQITIIGGRIGNMFIGRLINEGMVLAVLKQLGTRVAAKSAASIVPVVGSAVGAGVSFGMMKLVGNRHVEDCYQLVAEMLGNGDGVIPSAAA